MLLEDSVRLSLVIQFILGVVSLEGISSKLAEKDFMLRDILKLDTLVQWIEFTFYIYLSKVITLGDNTWIRYWDWLITTPIMLITTIMFMDYNSGKSNNTKKWLQENKNNIIIVVISNFLMLFFGYLGETKRMDMNSSFVLGTIPFLYSFYLIYTKYVKETNKTNNALFFIMFIVWSLYGIGFMFDYDSKNTLYNFLDIISKNCYGLFIYIMVKKKAV
jgi:bacteriorhodopsin